MVLLIQSCERTHISGEGPWTQGGGSSVHTLDEPTASISTPGQRHKVREQLQSDLLALLGVKLRCENIVAPDGRREGFAVFGLRGHDGLVHRLRKKAVDKIDETAAGQALEQRALRSHNFNLIPADLRNLQPGTVRE